LHIQAWLESVPAVSIYLLVAVVIGVESFGIPMPGEIVLVSAALLAAQQGHIDPVVLGVCASAGAIIGDSIGYAVGRKGGRPLIAWLGRRFPGHFSAPNIARAERSFEKWGMWAVFFGRFIALLRIFAGPLAGALKMHYPKFLAANALGGIFWAAGTTFAVYYLGIAAEKWLSRFSWAGLVVALLVGLTVGWLIKRKTERLADKYAEEQEQGTVS
jgi:membrane protein DedA with SNARE-associated domain